MLPFNAWKVSKYGVISGPNTEKYGPEKTPYLDTFHAVPWWISPCKNSKDIDAFLLKYTRVKPSLSLFPVSRSLSQNFRKNWRDSKENWLQSHKHADGRTDKHKFIVTFLPEVHKSLWWMTKIIKTYKISIKQILQITMK